MSEVRAIQLAHVRYHIADEFCLSVFSDHAYLLLDINRAHSDHYRGIAALFGYGDHVRYAKHHDLTHHWLCEQEGGPSPTLHGEAHRRPFPDADAEETVVNALQRVWARDRAGEAMLPEDDAAIGARMGPAWPARAVPLFDLLDSVE